HLLPIIDRYRARHPHIKIEVKRSLGSRIPSEVLGRDVDLGMVTYPPNHPALKSQPVGSDELALFVAPSHPLAGRADVSVRELGVESFIAHNVRSPYRERVIETFRKHKTPLNIAMELPTLESIKRTVATGAGVALMPKLAARLELERGDVVAVAVREMKFERKLLLISRKGAKLSHAAKAFLTCARG
ncbi:MAG: LysR family transcriptional regulator substrate-binding protein, partial [Acidobacteria bacterium]|nr:LysR family transcriptional regulator substrate-binding protein [Acidobacteriota bacterium]